MAVVDATNDAGSTVLAALRLADDRACERYLTARKAMLGIARYGLSLLHLAAQQPGRADYQRASDLAREQFRDADTRCRLAYSTWQRAARRYDAAWTATEGRTPRLRAA